MSGARSKEKLRTSAESQVGVLYCTVQCKVCVQVMFNEAIRKVIEEKDRRIDTLENSLKSRWCLITSPIKYLDQYCLLCSQVSSTQGVISALEEQLAEVQRRNAQLDSELRAAQLTKLDMAASIAPVSTTVTSTLYLEFILY